MTSRWRGGLSRHPRVLGFLLGVYWLAMFLATHIQLPEVESAPKNTDKVVHLAMYAGLTFLLSSWLSARRPGSGRLVVPVLAAAVVYAGLDESLQMLTETRTADFWDFVMDVLGAVLGVGLFGAFRAKFSPLWEASPPGE